MRFTSVKRIQYVQKRPCVHIPLRYVHTTNFVRVFYARVHCWRFVFEKKTPQNDGCVVCSVIYGSNSGFGIALKQ